MANTALNRTTVALLTNKSGGSLNYGDVVVLDNTNSNGFTTTTSAALSTRGIGVIMEPNGIANNATGTVGLGGWIPKVNLNTAATVGQFINTHTVAGQATPHSSPQVEGDFGIALDATATPTAILFGSPNSAAGSGTVTHTGGSLTLNELVLGAGSADLKTVAATDGQVPIGKSSDGTVTLGTITAGTGITVTNGAASITIAASGATAGLVLVEQHTASASASLDFTTAISATYDDYQIEFVNVVMATDGASLLFRMGGGSFDSGANYTRCGYYMGVGDAMTGYTALTQTSISIANSFKTGGSLSINGRWMFYNPGSASLFKQACGEVMAVAVGTTNLYKWGLGGSWNSTTAVDRFQFLGSSGNIASGTIRVYGIAKT